MKKALFIGDTHFPFQDDPAISLVLGLLAKEKFDAIIHLGDLVDCYSISRFDKDKDRMIGLKHEIGQAHDFLAAINKLAPKSHKVLFEGNHENRLYRQLCSLSGPAAEILNLPTVKNALEWPVLLNLKPIGWQFVKYDRQPVTTILPKLAVMHGNLVRASSCYSAKGQMDRFGMSGISGHTHRLGKYYHRTYEKDGTWIENGCLCNLTPTYSSFTNWQTGFSIAHYDDKRIWNIDTIQIINKQFYYNGRVYT